MEAIKTTTNRIHPLMAAAAASVIVVSLVGTAAITGVLPSSHSAPEAALVSSQAAGPGYAATMTPMSAAGVQQGVQQVPAGYAQQIPAGYAQPVAAAYPQPASAYPQQATAYAQQAPAPVVIKETVIKEVPAPRHHVVHHTSYASNDGYYAPRPAPQPNYIGIGTGAVIGGLIGNQVGGGNGKKLATVAGIIGGGMIGNQMINR
jgi:uncharacterized protein YcfJ